MLCMCQIIKTTSRPSTAVQWARRTAAARRAAIDQSLAMSPRHGGSTREINLGILRDELEAAYHEALYDVRLQTQFY